MFDIDPVTLIMSCVLFCAFAAPFIYYANQNGKKELALKAKLTKTALAGEATPDQVEVWRNQFGLGLDSKKNILVYLHESEVNISYIVDLEDVKQAVVRKRTREVNGTSGKTTVVDYVGLELHYKAENKKSILLEIYDGEEFTDLLGETVLAEKWAGLINQRLN
jgi:iron only hydrogenase large subunit-like protein